MISQTLEKLHEMRLLGMTKALSSQLEHPAVQDLSFEERLGLLVDSEYTYRKNRRLTRLLKEAKLRLEASVENIDFRYPRGLDKGFILSLQSSEWIRSGQNLLVVGPTGTGKTFIACALANAACRNGISARYYRMSRLLTELTAAKGDGSYPRLLSRLAKTQLLILDDWGLAPLGPQEGRDILELIDDRTGLCSTMVVSQLPVKDWHPTISDPTVADAILDRILHKSHRITLRGDSMRRTTNQDSDHNS